MSRDARRGQTRQPGGDLAGRVAALRQAADAATDRLADDLVVDARAVADRVDQRLRLSAEHTVVALAGSTGSGKSSLFNAVAGLDLAVVGARRPTTSQVLACTWGQGSGELLDWLGVPRRHQLTHTSALDSAPNDGALSGLVLLDLPDHDSTEWSHRLEVDRLVRLVDVLVWVLDPQKYADAAVHERYLRPLAGHADVTMVALNHADEVPPDELARCLADLRRLLVEDGLTGVPVLATSAATGAGVRELHEELASRVVAKRSAAQRLTADVTAAARQLSEQAGGAGAERSGRQVRTRLVNAFAEAAGIPVVVAAVDQAYRARARQATGWPVTRWLGRVRPDPLRRLHLDRRAAGGVDGGGARSSLPRATPVQRAAVDGALRRLVDDVAEGLPRPWVDAVRRAARPGDDDLSDALDRAVTGTDLGVDRRPSWWRAARGVQWLLLAVTVVGAGWLAVLAGMSYLRLPEPATPRWEGLPAPTALLLGGLVGGVLVALLCRVVAGFAARRRARAADRALRAAIGPVAERLVFEPVDAELANHRRYREAVAAAHSSG